MSGLDGLAFRRALGRFASGVTVVTTVADGIDHAMTASAFSSVSLDPPLVQVCVQSSNRFHGAVVASGTWAVSILGRDGQGAASWFATRGRPLEHQLDRVGHHRAALVPAALVDDGVAWLECRTWATYPGGDHTILVGEVLAARVGDDSDDPLLYYHSHYGALLPSEASEKSTPPPRARSADNG
ncbi:MAG: flavin reductase family protein [Nocardioidaceae bacterium]